MSVDHLEASMRVIADSLSRPADRDDAVARITAAAVETVLGADLASISVRRPDDALDTIAPTDALATRMDELQYELREGPCYEAVTDESALYSPSVVEDDRWPRFGPKAAELGVQSQLAIRLNAQAGTVTGLNLYSRSPNAFTDDPGLPQLFASHARVALGYAAELESLRGAVGTREVIGKAIGVVMFKYDLSSERAFEFLIRLSQTSNVKLRDVAARIVDSRGARQ